MDQRDPKRKRPTENKRQGSAKRVGNVFRSHQLYSDDSLHTHNKFSPLLHLENYHLSDEFIEDDATNRHVRKLVQDSAQTNDDNGLKRFNRREQESCNKENARKNILSKKIKFGNHLKINLTMNNRPRSCNRLQYHRKQLNESNRAFSDGAINEHNENNISYSLDEFPPLKNSWERFHGQKSANEASYKRPLLDIKYSEETSMQACKPRENETCWNSQRTNVMIKSLQNDSDDMEYQSDENESSMRFRSHCWEIIGKSLQKIENSTDTKQSHGDKENQENFTSKDLHLTVLRKCLPIKSDKNDKNRFSCKTERIKKNAFIEIACDPTNRDLLQSEENNLKYNKNEHEFKLFGDACPTDAGKNFFGAKGAVDLLRKRSFEAYKRGLFQEGSHKREPSSELPHLADSREAKIVTNKVESWGCLSGAWKAFNETHQVHCTETNHNKGEAMIEGYRKDILFKSKETQKLRQNVTCYNDSMYIPSCSSKVFGKSWKDKTYSAERTVWSEREEERQEYRERNDTNLRKDGLMHCYNGRSYEVEELFIGKQEINNSSSTEQQKISDGIPSDLMSTDRIRPHDVEIDNEQKACKFTREQIKSEEKKKCSELESILGLPIEEFW